MKTKIFSNKPFTFSIHGRPFTLFEVISYTLMFASVPMLAFGINHYNEQIIITILLTIVSLYSGFFAALIWNDITDKEIDTLVHPKRNLPSGKITVKKFFAIALIFSAMTFIFSYLIDIWCFILVGSTALFVTFHNKYLKKKVQFPAFSEIFTPVQWIIVPIFGFIAVNSSNYYDMIILVIFTYFADSAHDLPEGIHDIKGDLKFGIKTYATSFGEKQTAKISFAMFFISGLIGILLFIKTILSFIFLVLFLLFWIYTLKWSYKLIKSDKKNMGEIGRIVGKKGFDFFLMAYTLMFFDILIQLILFHFF